MLILGIVFALLAWLFCPRITLVRALTAALFPALGMPAFTAFSVAAAFIDSTFFYGSPEWFVYMCFRCMDVDSLRFFLIPAIFVAGITFLVYLGMRRFFEGIVYALLIVGPIALSNFLPVDSRVLLPVCIVVFGVVAWRFIRWEQAFDAGLWAIFFLLTVGVAFLDMLPIEIEGVLVTFGAVWVFVVLGYFLERRMGARKSPIGREQLQVGAE